MFLFACRKRRHEEAVSVACHHVGTPTPDNRITTYLQLPLLGACGARQSGGTRAGSLGERRTTTPSCPGLGTLRRVAGVLVEPSTCAWPHTPRVLPRRVPRCVYWERCVCVCVCVCVRHGAGWITRRRNDVYLGHVRNGVQGAETEVSSVVRV
jgi:hypothetical protein